MAVELELETISSGYNISKINTNFQAIDTALQDAVSRSGTAPNQMDADFDMNGNDILNVDNLEANVITIDGVPVSVEVPVGIDTDALVPSGGTIGQVLTKLSSTSFDMDWEDPTSSGGGSSVATRGALKAIIPDESDAVYLAEENREGWFVWRLGDFSAEEAADTEEGLFISSNISPSTIGIWVRQYDGYVQAKWFDASPENTDTANDTAFAAINSLGITYGPVQLEDGVYQTTSTQYQVNGIAFVGPGKIELGGFAQAPNRTFLLTDPGDPSASRLEVFDDLTVKNQDQKYMFVGANVGSTPGVTYRTLTGATREMTIYEFVGGHNTDPADHSLGRTGAAGSFDRAYHGGQGDVTIRQAYGEVFSARVGATHFLANPAIGIENGGVAATASATGAYLQLTEHIMNDGGLAVAAVARVTNFVRTNSGTALGQVWVHDRPQTGGSQAADAVYTPAGSWKRGLDFTPTTLDSDKAAVVLKASDRIYFNSTSAADALGIKWFATTLGSLYMDSDSFQIRFSGSIKPTANDGGTLGISGTAWADLFLANGAVINWNAGEVLLTHSTNALNLNSREFIVNNSFNFRPQIVARNETNDANGPYFMVRKSRGVADTAVQVSDTLGTFMFQGYDSTGTPVLRNAANLNAIVESVTAGTLTARFELVAGSAVWQFKTNSTLTLPTATLTTAAANTVEFDGKVFYANAVASSRQVVTTKQVATVQGTAVALSNSSTSAQNIFAAANDTLTVAASTSYRFRAKLSFNTGATTHITSFSLGGTATFTNIEYVSNATSTAANTLGTPQMRRVTTAAAAALTATSVAVTTDIWIEGVMRINGAGTIIPQVTFSAGPTGTCETAINSFFELEPIGSDTVAAVGNWA